MARLLILDAHSDAAIACLQSLGRAGHEIWIGGARDTTVAFSSRYPARRFTYPDPQRDTRAFLQWLREVARDGSVDLILPVSDATIRPLMQLRREWSDGPAIVLPGDSAFECAFDKDRTYELAESVNVPVPASVLVRHTGEWRGQVVHALPVFVKPVRSKVWKDGRGYSLVPELAITEDELFAAMERFLPLSPVQVQQYFPGEGIGIEVLCRHGEVVMHFAHRRLHEYPLTGGRSTYRQAIEPRPEWLDAARRLMGALEWHGVAMVELKVNIDGYALMEVNGRFWGSLPLAVASGVDFPRALVGLWLDDERPMQPAYRRGYRMRNLGFDLVWMRDNWRADRADPMVLSRPRLKSLGEWLLPLLGREGWDHFSWRDPGPGLRQLRDLAGDQGGKVIGAVRRRLRRRRAIRISRRRVEGIAPSAKCILVLCYGNIYRSPLAAALLRRQLPCDVEVISAGFHPRPGRPCAEDYISAVAQWGVDLASHRSRIVDAAIMEAVDLIVIMDERNERLAGELSPATRARQVWLGAFDESGDPEIPDPYGCTQAFTADVIRRVDAACSGFAQQFLRARPEDAPVSEQAQ